MSLRLYQKSTLTLVGANIWTPLPIPNLLGKTLFQGNSTGMRFPIHHMKTSAAIVYHRTYIEFDFCKVRTGDTCSECLPGYIKVPSGNDCFPSSTGIDLATGQLAPCSVAGCLDCSSDSKICLKCMKTSPKLYVLNNVCVPSLIKGFGPSGDKLLNCDSPDCLDCSESYKTCSFCDFLKDSHEYAGRCVRLPEMKKLHLGVDLLNFQAKPCKTSQCLDCLADYLDCTVCDATNGYGLDGNATACQDLFASNKEERVRTTFDVVARTITMRFRGPIDLPSVEDSVFDITLTDAGDFRGGLNCSAADSLVRVRI